MEYTFRCRKRFSVVASWSTALPIGFTEVIIYDCMEYTFRCRKRFSVVASWSTSFHGRKRPTEKSFSVVVRQQAEGLVIKFALTRTQQHLTKHLSNTVIRTFEWQKP